jgi:CHAT domain
MADWAQYRRRFLEGNSSAENLARLRMMEGWLALPVPEMEAAAKEEFSGLEEIDLRPIYQLACALRLHVTSDADRLTKVKQLCEGLLAMYPGMGTIPPEVLAGNETRQKMGPICDRLRQVAVVPGMTTPHTIPTLMRILADFQLLVEQAEKNNPGRADVLYFMGETASALGSAHALESQNDEALKWLEQSGTWFDEAGDEKHAPACRSQAAALELKISGDVDRAKQRLLRSVLDGSSDLLVKASALADLSRLMNGAGDAYESGQVAEECAAEMVRAGFEDPEGRGLDAAVDAWVDQACGMALGRTLFVLVSKVCGIYLGVLDGRVAGNVVKDPVRAACADEMTRAIHAVTARINAETVAAEQEIAEQLKTYFPSAQEPEAKSVNQDEQFAAMQQQITQLDDALLALRSECDSRRRAGAPMEDLLAATVSMQPMAESLGMPLFTVKLKLARSYILMAAGRIQESSDRAEEARGLLVGKRPATIHSFSEAYERALYVEALDRKVRAMMMLGYFAGGLKFSQNAISDFERERYRVNSPYQQSAFLSSAVGFYINAIFGAFKLQDWDALLETMELIKARSAIRSRLSAPPPELSVAELARNFDETNVALQGELADGDKKTIADLSVRRRWLWDLMAIARAQGGAAGTPPELSVKVVQSSLEEDEAALAYFWLGVNVLLIVAVDRDRFQVERVILSDEDGDAVNEFIAAVQGLRGFLKLDGPVAEAGALLLPGTIRTFISGKKRLIISPHRGLHLFPFQAAKWENGFLIERFALRFVPNLSSLLVPWRGSKEKKVLAAGVNLFQVRGEKLPELPNAEEEAKSVAGAYTVADVLLGSEASHARIESLRQSGELSKYRCIHLATHGTSVFADDARDEPMESKLFLQDAALDGMEVAGLKLAAELVVLSACNSGQRAIAGRGLNEVPGDDIFGLQSALFQAGARTILGALWPVETKSAALIVTSFHRHFAAGKPAEFALQAAIVENLADPAIGRKPYLWAPFFLSSIGSMRADVE